MLLDTNILLYAVDRSSPFHQRATDWLTDQLGGSRRLAFPWPTILAFLRIATNPRIFSAPLTTSQALGCVRNWLSSDLVWVPAAGPRHMDLMTALLERYQLTGNMIPDAHLAALAIEHGLPVCSADTDFARFADADLKWINPLAG